MAGISVKKKRIVNEPRLAKDGLRGGMSEFIKRPDNESLKSVARVKIIFFIYGLSQRQQYLSVASCLFFPPS